MSQKLYEGMFIFDSNLATKDWHALEQHVQDLMARNGAVIEYSERWPDRRLAYEINGCKKGTYYLTYFRAPKTAIQGLTRDCQLSERVLRVLILHDEAFEELCEKRKNREAEAEAAAKAAAEARDKSSEDEDEDSYDSDDSDDSGDSDEDAPRLSRARSSGED